MTTSFTKALENGEDVVGKHIVLLTPLGTRWRDGTVFTVTKNNPICCLFETDKGVVHYKYSYYFEFKEVQDSGKLSQDAFKQECLSSFLAETDEENKRLKEQLERVVEANKQYEQQLKQCRDDLFNLRMENARLELAALRWSMFDCEVNRNTADKLLKKLADDAVETYN